MGDKYIIILCSRLAYYLDLMYQNDFTNIKNMSSNINVLE